MLKKFLAAALAGAVAKLVLDKLNSANSHEADLWAEATDPVESAR